MSRPSDWSALDWSVDPVPGSPDEIQDGAVHMAQVATVIADAARNLREIASSDGQQSQAVDAFRERARLVADEIALVEERYAQTAEALAGYVEPLREAQAMSLSALEAAVAARERVWAAEADVASASLDLQYAVEDSDRTTAQARLEDALGRLSSAQGDLSDARSALTAAISHRDGAAESTMALIDAALEVNDLNDSAWRQFLNRHADLLDGIAKVLAIAGAVVAVVALFIPGVNVLVGLGIGLGAAAINFALAENGNKDWTDFAWDVFGLATLGAGKLLALGMRGARAARVSRVAGNRSNVLAGPPVPRGTRMPHGRHRPGGKSRNKQRRQRMEQGRQAQAAEYSRMTTAPSWSVLDPSSMLRAARHNVATNGWGNVIAAGGGDAYQMSYYAAMRAPGMGGGRAAAELYSMSQVSGTLSNLSTVHTLWGADLSGAPRPGATWLGEHIDAMVPDQGRQDDVVGSR